MHLLQPATLSRLVGLALAGPLIREEHTVIPRPLICPMLEHICPLQARDIPVNVPCHQTCPSLPTPTRLRLPTSLLPMPPLPTWPHRPCLGVVCPLKKRAQSPRLILVVGPIPTAVEKLKRTVAELVHAPHAGKRSTITKSSSPAKPTLPNMGTGYWKPTCNTDGKP